MSSENRPLVMRSNRLLGASLVDHNLVKIEDLEKANERLLEILSEGTLRQMSLLAVLCFEMKVLKEEDVLLHLTESEGVGLVDLHQYDMSEDLRKNIDISACWATWSVPFDKEEDFISIATAYYLSPAVRSYWEKIYQGTIIWYGTSLEVIADILEKHQADRNAVANS